MFNATLLWFHQLTYSQFADRVANRYIVDICKVDFSQPAWSGQLWKGFYHSSAAKSI